DDEYRRARLDRERNQKDSLESLKTRIDTAGAKSIDSLQKRELQISVTASAGLSKTDSIFNQKVIRRKAQTDSVADVRQPEDAVERKEIKKIRRAAPLTDAERELIDSVVVKRGYISNAFTMALNNSRNLKNTFDVKRSQVDSHEREYRRYEIA